MKRTLLMAVCWLLAGVASAQEKPAPEKPAPEKPVERTRKPSVPLKLQVVYGRYQGEKRISNVPYTLLFNSDERQVQLRMGLMVPIQTIVNGAPAMTYKDVGNNLDCSADSLDDGRFRLQCSFDQSSVASNEAEKNATGTAAATLTSLAPVIRNFRSTANMSLRDGQSVQLTSATDPLSGDVLKIDITLNVLK